MVLGIPLGTKGAAVEAFEATRKEGAHAGGSKGRPLVVSFDLVRPSQLGYSPENVEKKKKKIIKEGHIKDGVYDNSEGIPVVEVEGKEGIEYRIMDKHHSAKAALELGAEKALVCIKARYTTEEFDVCLKSVKGKMPADGKSLLAYPWHRAEGGVQFRPLPDSLSELQDNPNRTFLAYVKILHENGGIEHPGEGIYAVWQKFMERVPNFAEFILADVLYAFGFEAGAEDHQDWDRCKEAWSILSEAKRGNTKDVHPFTWTGFNLDWLELAPQPRRVSKRRRK